MLAVELLLAFEYTPLAVGGIVIAIILAMGLLVPYLIKEIRGKVELGPRTPTGAGDTHPGRRGDPAPGQPEAQADPYTRRAQR
jgi:hypothetical protein